MSLPMMTRACLPSSLQHLGERLTDVEGHRRRPSGTGWPLRGCRRFRTTCPCGTPSGVFEAQASANRPRSATRVAAARIATFATIAVSHAVPAALDASNTVPGSRRHRRRCRRASARASARAVGGTPSVPGTPSTQSKPATISAACSTSWRRPGSSPTRHLGDHRRQPLGRARCVRRRGRPTAPPEHQSPNSWASKNGRRAARYHASSATREAR